MIVGIGELLWDVYPDGRRVAGGAPFNFAFHCHQLGHPAAIVSRVGDDDLGRELREQVRRMRVRDDWIQTDPVHPTGTVQVTLDANKVPSYTITEDVAWDYIEWTPELNRLAAMRSPRSGARNPDEVEAVCFGTLALRSEVSRGSIFALLSSLRRGIPKILDVNFRPPFLPTVSTLIQCYEYATWLKISADDLSKGRSVIDEVICTIGEERLEQTVVVTDGDKGCRGNGVGGFPFVEHAVTAKVVDTVGAGDAFTAAMVCLHLEGRPLQECARFANHYAARVCEHQGATPKIDRAEVERAAFGSP